MIASSSVACPFETEAFPASHGPQDALAERVVALQGGEDAAIVGPGRRLGLRGRPEDPQEVARVPGPLRGTSSGIKAPG